MILKFVDPVLALCLTNTTLAYFVHCKLIIINCFGKKKKVSFSHMTGILHPALYSKPIIDIFFFYLINGIGAC